MDRAKEKHFGENPCRSRIHHYHRRLCLSSPPASLSLLFTGVSVSPLHRRLCLSSSPPSLSLLSTAVSFSPLLSLYLSLRRCLRLSTAVSVSRPLSFLQLLDLSIPDISVRSRSSKRPSLWLRSGLLLILMLARQDPPLHRPRSCSTPHTWSYH